MREKRILRVLGQVDEKFIEEAAPVKVFAESTSSHASRSRKRLQFTLLAAIILLLGSFTAAMAANEDFREAVFHFLGIEQTESVPEHETDAVLTPKDIEVDDMKNNIGDVVEGTYIHTPIASYAEAGVFLVCSDEAQMKQGSHYDAYREENGELVKLKVHGFQETLSVNGYTFETDFEWTEVDGRTVITYMEPSAQYLIEDFAGAPEQTLVLFYCWTQNDEEGYQYTYYPAFVNLKTGTVSDVLAGTGANELKEIVKAAASEDQTKMLLITSDLSVYYADLLAKKLCSVNELSGEPITDCSLIHDTLVCWSMEDPSSESAAFGKYRIWAINLNTLERKELPVTADRETLFMGFNTAFSTGNMYAGNCFALQVDEDRNTYIVDLKTGTTTLIAGFLWPGSFPFVGTVPSPDGRKLLIYGEKTENCFDYIGVMDFDRKVYIQFSRENSNEVNEHRAYWFENEKIVIKTDSSEVSTDYYVYELTG